MIFNIFKGEAKTRNKSRVKETDFLSKLSSVWSERSGGLRVFTGTLSPLLTAQCQHSIYRERKIAIVVAAIGEKELF